MSTDESLRAVRQMGSLLARMAKDRVAAALNEMPSVSQDASRDVDAWVDELVEHGKKASAELLDSLRGDFIAQLSFFGIDPRDLLSRLSGLLDEEAGADGDGAPRAQGTAARTPGDGTTHRAGREPDPPPAVDDPDAAARPASSAVPDRTARSVVAHVDGTRKKKKNKKKNSKGKKDTTRNAKDGTSKRAKKKNDAARDDR